MKKYKIKCIACILLLCTLVTTVYGDLPQPTIDETLYVNLDYYGNQSLANVVKTYTLNGHDSIEDKGEYTHITNMTDTTKPQATEEGVKWHFNKPPSRFYFEGRLEDVPLPWTFDVSYELNGVPTKAEALAGQSGYIEIIIKAVPNKEVDPYYQNNMLLQIAATVNMDQNLSLKAEGAQIQTIGGSKMVMFVAMPGETKTFKMGIGTESFSFGGVSMMMVPAKMEQFEMLTNLSDKIPDIEVAASGINQSIDAILNSMRGLGGSIDALQNGITNIQTGIAGANEDMPKLLENHQKIMEQLGELLSNMDETLPQFSEAESLVEKLYVHGNTMMDHILSTDRDIKDLKQGMGALEDTLESLDQLITHLSEVEANKLLEEFYQKVQSTKQRISALKHNFYNLGQSLGYLQDTLYKLENILGGGILEEFRWILGDASQTVVSLGHLLGEIESSIGLLDSVDKLLSSYEKILEDYKGLGKEGIQALIQSVDEVGDLLGKVLDMQVTLEEIGVTMEEAKAKLLIFLNTSEKLATTMRHILEQTIIQLEAVEDVLNKQGPLLSEGMNQTLEGMNSALSVAEGALGNLSVIKSSKDTLVNIISETWQALTHHTTLLKVDPNAPIISITSKDNPSPESLQIIVRTQEIMKTSSAEGVIDLEPEKEKVGIVERIKELCTTLWENIKSFCDRIFGSKG